MEKKRRFFALGLFIIVMAFALHSVIVWQFVPLNWFSHWSETLIRSGCDIKLGATEIPDRVPLEQEFVIRVSVRNPSINEACVAEGMLLAPEFYVQEEKGQLRKSLPPGGSKDFVWHLYPKNNPGKSPIWITVNSKTLRYTIASESPGLGLPDAGILVSILGYFFGGWLSVPWWIERLRQRRQGLEGGAPGA